MEQVGNYDKQTQTNGIVVYVPLKFPVIPVMRTPFPYINLNELFQEITDK